MSVGEHLFIQPGRTYWVQLDNVRVKARAMEPMSSGLWWLCIAEPETEITVPVDSIGDECGNDYEPNFFEEPAPNSCA